METIFFSSIAFFFLSLYLLFELLFKKLGKKIPPSPPSLPFIGHLHLLKKPLHRTLAGLSARYGPLLFLRFGSRRVLVVSSHSLAAECFSKNDLAFASRPRLPSGRYLTYNYTTIGFSPYGPHWRNLRRIVAHELLSSSRLQSLADMRSAEVKLLLRRLHHEHSNNDDEDASTVAELRPRLFEMVLNVLMMAVAGKRYCDDDEARRFFEMVRGTFSFHGTSNLRDFLPVLRMFDFRGAREKLAKLESEWDLHLRGLIEEERKKNCVSSFLHEDRTKKTMMGVLLSMQEDDPKSYPDRFIKALFLSLLMAGTDTTTATLEWAMSLLLNHPQTLDKARTELDSVVGRDRLVEEKDLHNLPYLQGIINEALRLYPATPLLLPHESIEDCTVDGCHVQKGTILLVNAYTIHRDPNIWAEPERFKPERYFDELDGRQSKMLLLPFGLGRRRCPGENLAARMMGLALGGLIHCFEWERVGSELVDMEEGLGMSMPKAKPLQVMYRPRLDMVHVLSQL